jgi:phospholipase A1/A2
VVLIWLQLPACGALLVLAIEAMAQTHECANIIDDKKRLVCYDQIYRRESPPKIKPTDQPLEFAERGRAGSSMDERWDLQPSSARGRFVPRAYKPVYLIPFTYTNRVNNVRSSPAPGHQVDSPGDLDAAEAKFQLSLKTKIWEGVFGDRGNLWAAYTQSSRWQVYNGAASRPFRETNYEPELMLVFRTQYELLGWQGRMAAVSLNHQSNGRALPLSRSWNRIIGEVGLERGNIGLSARAWWRVPENAADDDNPDIADYFGRGEVLLSYTLARNVFSLQARHSLRGGERARGSLQVDWAFPIISNLHGYLQLFSGYGESMIDYNFRQNKIGLGISVIEWR